MRKNIRDEFEQPVRRSVSSTLLHMFQLRLCVKNVILFNVSDLIMMYVSDFMIKKLNCSKFYLFPRIMCNKLTMGCYINLVFTKQQYTMY